MKIAKIAVIAIAVIAAIMTVASIISADSSEKRYNEAVALYEEGKKEEAYDIFIDIKRYEDSVSKASSIFAETKLEKLRSADIGSYIYFGKYEQDNDLENGPEPIKWLILDKVDIGSERILVISQEALDAVAYDDALLTEELTWERSSIRNWLDKTFYPTAFDPVEQLFISEVSLTDDNGELYSENDKVFLLNTKEITKYLKTKEARTCRATSYAKAMGVHEQRYRVLDGKEYYSCYWWLRSTGETFRSAICIYENGDFSNIGNSATDDFRGVRPAMWLDLSAVNN